MTSTIALFRESRLNYFSITKFVSYIPIKSSPYLYVGPNSPFCITRNATALQPVYTARHDATQWSNCVVSGGVNWP